MEEKNTAAQVLELLLRPAFLAKGGKVTQVNIAAQQYNVHLGDSLEEMLLTGREECAKLQDGTLSLTLLLGNQNFGASVTPLNGDLLFILEDHRDLSLQAMALASRELREPLNIILATADQLFPKLSGDAETAGQLAQINRGLYQLLRLILNMSDAQRFTWEGSQDLQIRDIYAILNEILPKAEDLCRQAGVTLEYPILQDTVYCSVDEDLLERAIYNLLSNSLKFTPKGETIRIQIQKKTTQLCITLEDTGSGIPAEIQKNLFSRYLRPSILEDRSQGIGLGMVLVRAAAQIHGGTVLAEPSTHGARITLTISLAQRKESYLHTSYPTVDYAGERSHSLIELSDVLPAEAYPVDQIN